MRIVILINNIDVYIGSVWAQWSLTEVAVRTFDPCGLCFFYTGTHPHLKPFMDTNYKIARKQESIIGKVDLSQST